MRALLIILFAALVMAASSAQAILAGPLTIGALYQSCKFSDRVFANKYRDMSASDISEATFCNGYILGAVHGITAASEKAGKSSPRLFCLPADWTLIRGVELFTHWAEMHPKEAGNFSVEGIIASEAEMYPCPALPDTPVLHAVPAPTSDNPPLIIGPADQGTINR